MKKYRLENFTRGWLIGDFEPNIVKTKNFEVMVTSLEKGHKDPKHVHMVADEITIIISGSFKRNGEIYKAGDIIHLYPGESSDSECLEDGVCVAVKLPSVMGDKYLVEDKDQAGNFHA